MLHATRFMIYISSDHAGFELKKELLEHLKEQNMEAEDCGPFALDPADDYPDYVYPCALKVAARPGSVGVVIGGSGQGEAILANKVKGVRAAHYYGGHEEIITLSRQHNNANVLSLGARFMDGVQAKRALDLFIETGFEGGRHQRRIDKIAKLEQEN